MRELWLILIASSIYVFITVLSISPHWHCWDLRQLKYCSFIWKDITQKDIPLQSNLKYLFGPPGWRDDGRSISSNELRELGQM
jgi:hypothetical protein